MFGGIDWEAVRSAYGPLDFIPSVDSSTKPETCKFLESCWKARSVRPERMTAPGPSLKQQAPIDLG